MKFISILIEIRIHKRKCLLYTLIHINYYEVTFYRRELNKNDKWKKINSKKMTCVKFNKKLTFDKIIFIY